MTNQNTYVLSVFIVTICCCLQLQHCTAQQSSTVRPYKFGFTIDEQQHRREQRDERGIVMGEFGFITADGIYHVTVYATDEQGRFRILAMKSYPYESPPKTVEILMKPKAVQTTTTTTTTTTELPRHNFYNEACSGCFLSNGNSKPKSKGGETPKTDIRTLSKPLPTVPKTTNPGSQPKPTGGKPTLGNPAGGKPTLGSPIGGKPTVGSPALGSSATGTTGQSNPKQATLAPKTTTGQKDIMDVIFNEVLPSVIGMKGVVSKPPTAPSGKPPMKSFVPTGAGNPGKNSVANFNPKSTSSNAAGLNGDGDLYRFKYILDYHGHTETGKRNGNKEGNYFAIGDDDIERTIEYVANENGYQPRIHWRKRNQKGSLPQENTLKDYEFVWFTTK